MKHARPDYNRIQDPMNLIPTDEPVFLLRAQDCTAAEVVDFWASLQPAGALRNLAMAHAEVMRRWPRKKTADITNKQLSKKCGKVLHASIAKGSRLAHCKRLAGHTGECE